MDINRKTAMKALLDIEKKGAYSNLSLNENIKKYSPQDQAFVRDLTYGTLRNKYLLDHFLKTFISKGYNRLKTDVLTLLRMGAYQLIFMDSVPDYAAVSTSVDFAKKFLRGRESFINGVLRSMARGKADLVWPEKGEDVADYLSVRYSVNPWIAEILMDNMGEEGAEAYLKASNETPELILRTNLLKGSREELIEDLRALGFTAEPSKVSPRAVKASGTGILETEVFRSGRFAVQDEASILACDVLDPLPGMTLIDMCAAPGGKTASLGELMENKGQIFAFDIHEHKVALIEKAARRSGVSIVKALRADSRELREDLKETADRVLCDVPCSGFGVIRRKPEIKYKEPFDIGELAETQKRILSNGASYLKKGGALVYSTCTVDDTENQKVIESFLEENKGFIKDKEICMSPADGTDGFYICRLIREA